jgi:hypothetical protein
MKPILYNETIPVYREWKLSPVNKYMTKAVESPKYRTISFLKEKGLSLIYWIITRKTFIFWMKMIGIYPLD